MAAARSGIRVTIRDDFSFHFLNPRRKTCGDVYFEIGERFYFSSHDWKFATQLKGQPRPQGLSSSRSLGREEERPWGRGC